MTLNHLALTDIPLMPGDIIFRHSPGFMGWTARTFTKHRGEENGSLADHVGLIRDSEKALHYTFRGGPRMYTHEGYQAIMDEHEYEWQIWRWCRTLDPDEVAWLQKSMDSALEEKHYSHVELLLQGLDNILLEKILGRRIVLFRRLGGLWKDGVVCSTGTVKHLHAIGRLPRTAKTWNPDEMHDWCIRNEDEKVKLVGQSLGWPSTSRSS